MIEKIKPVLVLSIIMTVVATLLIVTYNLTYVDKSGVLTDELKEKCVFLMGEGEYNIVTDWKAEGYAIDKPENVEKLIKKSDGTIAFEIISDGYTGDGLDILVAMNADGSVKGVSVISNSDTPGIGTNIETEEFLGLFNNLSETLKIVKNTPKATTEIQAVTGATYSSKGAVNAVNIAIETYNEMGAVE